MFFKLILLFGILSVPMLLVMGRAVSANTETAYFAGGCFWCMEPPFENQDGVVEVTAGYIGGSGSAPTYEEVSTGRTGYLEAVKVVYDPSVVTYPELLEIFWRQIDPTDNGGQFADRGSQYHTAIFYATPEQKRQAEQSRDALDKSGIFDRPIVTAIREATSFYPAEQYHQDYYKTNPIHYKLYKSGSGRERFLDEMWHSAATSVDVSVAMTATSDPKTYEVPDDKQLKKTLTPLQYEVTRESATEPAFDNEYWDNHREGIYVDVISGRPLFSSTDKFDSGTGWPSFTKPIDESLIKEVEDRSLFTVRTEVRAKYSDAHLGHVFDDGPAPTGMRYCLNSAALRFVPKENMEAEGYGDYLRLFQK